MNKDIEIDWKSNTLLLVITTVMMSIVVHPTTIPSFLGIIIIAIIWLFTINFLVVLINIFILLKPFFIKIFYNIFGTKVIYEQRIPYEIEEILKSLNEQKICFKMYINNSVFGGSEEIINRLSPLTDNTWFFFFLRKKDAIYFKTVWC